MRIHYENTQTPPKKETVVTVTETVQKAEASDTPEKMSVAKRQDSARKEFSISEKGKMIQFASEHPKESLDFLLQQHPKVLLESVRQDPKLFGEIANEMLKDHDVREFCESAIRELSRRLGKRQEIPPESVDQQLQDLRDFAGYLFNATQDLKGNITGVEQNITSLNTTVGDINDRFGNYKNDNDSTWKSQNAENIVLEVLVGVLSIISVINIIRIDKMQKEIDDINRLSQAANQRSDERAQPADTQAPSTDAREQGGQDAQTSDTLGSAPQRQTQASSSQTRQDRSGEEIEMGPI